MISYKDLEGKTKLDIIHFIYGLGTNQVSYNMFIYTLHEEMEYVYSNLFINDDSIFKIIGSKYNIEEKKFYFLTIEYSIVADTFILMKKYKTSKIINNVDHNFQECSILL